MHSLLQVASQPHDCVCKDVNILDSSDVILYSNNVSKYRLMNDRRQDIPAASVRASIHLFAILSTENLH